MPRYKEVQGKIYEEASTRAEGMTNRDMLLLMCGCFAILGVLAALGTVALGFVIDTRLGLDEHRYCLDLTGCKELEPLGGNPPGCRGDPNGFAFAKITVKTSGQDSICIDILADDIGLPITAMHIHGPLNVADPENTGIFVPEDGTSSFDVTVDEASDGIRIISCENVASATSKAIIDNPQLFYLNVHNGAFPNGALRDQLGNGCRG
ncbi:MAG TPA: CHRD domain-containing protein [bacterium]|nr:CHRD domain-containing protein [bacterium]